MRLTSLIVLAAVASVGWASWPADADAQTRNRGATRTQGEAYPGARPSRVTRLTRQGARTRITVRRARSYLDAGTEVLPQSQSYQDYAFPPLYYPSRNWDTTGARRFPLPDNYYLPGWTVE